MTKILFIFCLLISSTLPAAQTPPQATTTQHEFAQTLFAGKLRKIRGLYNHTNNLLRWWHKAQTKDQMEEHARIALAAGDTELHDTILRIGYRNRIEQGVHWAWDNKWALVGAAAAVGMAYRNNQRILELESNRGNTKSKLDTALAAKTTLPSVTQGHESCRQTILGLENSLRDAQGVANQYQYTQKENFRLANELSATKREFEKTKEANTKLNSQMEERGNLHYARIASQLLPCPFTTCEHHKGKTYGPHTHPHKVDITLNPNSQHNILFTRPGAAPYYMDVVQKLQ